MLLGGEVSRRVVYCELEIRSEAFPEVKCHAMAIKIDSRSVQRKKIDLPLQLNPSVTQPIRRLGQASEVAAIPGDTELVPLEVKYLT
jgi:hypothetical protein